MIQKIEISPIRFKLFIKDNYFTFHTNSGFKYIYNDLRSNFLSNGDK